MHEDFVSLVCDSVLPNPLDYSCTSPVCSLPSPFPKCYLDEPIDNRMICNTNVDFGLFGITCLMCLMEILIILCL